MSAPLGRRLTFRLIAVQLVVLTAPILALITLRGSSIDQIRMTAIVVELTLLAAVLLSVLVAWSILRPLARLQDAAERVAKGERRISGPIGGEDEIGDSVAAVDRLLGRLDEQMKTLVVYAAESSHRMRTSLAAVRGAAEILREERVPEDIRKRFSGHIVTEVGRMERSLRETLTLARLESGSLTPHYSNVDVGPRLLETAEAIMRDTALETVGFSTAHMIRCDIELVQDAVAALLENAVKFAAPNGRIRLSISGEMDRIAILVEDSGPGLKTDVADRIFDRFFTTGEPAPDGSPATGLGLPIARAIARLHKGDLTGERSDLGGARFIFTIPT